MRRAAILGLALAHAGCGGSPALPAEPALVSVALMRGFAEPVAGGTPPRLVALLDATAPMGARDDSGIDHLEAARTSSARWLDALPEQTPVELRVIGGVREAGCTSPARLVADADTPRDAWLGGLESLSPAGEGSLADALFDLATAIPRSDPTPLRVVAWSALRDTCGISLCDAARQLARRGGYLDLVVLGDAPVPRCLAEIEVAAARVPPAALREVGFRVERVGREPAVVACSEAGGLPVAVGPGVARLVVGLEPPLVLERGFPAASRWVLEIVDFPALDPPARHWRWRDLAAPEARRDAP